MPYKGTDPLQNRQIAGAITQEQHYIERLRGGNNPYSHEVLKDNPRAYWRLNDALGSTSILDSSGNARHLTTVGTVLFQSDSPTGTTGATMYGTGINGGLSATTIGITGTGAFTVEFWFRTIATTTQRFYNQRADGENTGTVQSYLLENGLLYFAHGDEGAGSFFENNSGVPLNDGNWKHVALTRSSSGVSKMYVNTTMLFNLSAASNPIASRIGHFGYNRNGNNQIFNGSISDVAIYDTELSAARVQAHYNARVTQFARINALTSEILADAPYAYLRGDIGIAGEVDAGVSGQGVVFPLSITGGQSGGVLGNKQLLMNGNDTPLTAFASNVARGKNTWTVEFFANSSDAIPSLTSFTGNKMFLGGGNITNNAILSPGGAEASGDRSVCISVGTNGIKLTDPYYDGAVRLNWAGTINTLTHVVVRSVSKFLEIWVNGVLVASATTVSAARDLYAPYSITSRFGAPSEQSNNGAYNGFLSNIALYNYALSPIRIMKHADVGLSRGEESMYETWDYKEILFGSGY